MNIDKYVDQLAGDLAPILEQWTKQANKEKAMTNKILSGAELFRALEAKLQDCKQTLEQALGAEAGNVRISAWFGYRTGAELYFDLEAGKWGDTVEVKQVKDLDAGVAELLRRRGFKQSQEALQLTSQVEGKVTELEARSIHPVDTLVEPEDQIPF